MRTRNALYWPGYVLIVLGVLRAVFPVEGCVFATETYPRIMATLYVPWQTCASFGYPDQPVNPIASITAVQAIIFLVVGAGWLAWERWR